MLHWDISKLENGTTATLTNDSAIFSVWNITKEATHKQIAIPKLNSWVDQKWDIRPNETKSADKNKRSLDYCNCISDYSVSPSDFDGCKGKRFSVNSTRRQPG